METKHTPAPWRWEFNGNAGNEYLASGSIEDGTFQWVGTKEDKLVQAAAPELLEALVELFAQSNCLDVPAPFDAVFPFTDDTQSDELRAARDKARAAIAKATGTQP